MTTIYQSYAMHHPDGTLMCYCTAKKANWYINRNLATWISIEKKSFQLTFPPNGHGKSDNKYYVQLLENKCIVCGKTHDLNKHHVFPYVFRSRMPLEYKKSNHHDILVICIDCHENYETFATMYKEEIANKYNTSMNQTSGSEKSINKKIDNAKKILFNYENNSLLDKDGNKIILSKQKLDDIKVKASKEKLIEVEVEFWADTIMKNILLENNLQDFVVSWRKHFIQYAKPNFLPKHWDVNAIIEVVG